MFYTSSILSCAPYCTSPFIQAIEAQSSNNSARTPSAVSDRGHTDQSQEENTTTITLVKGENGFGFVIKAKDKPGPVTVGSVRVGGAAIKYSEMRKGARILSINGTDTRAMTKR